ncbi:DUF2474 domain-containing protein [Cupriavidus sp. 2TAF22]|uniref:DUF2474 domain-containing protein n=1 Tax=unclassified Cupriavidus TaxID=2640874 RepID=UPI003F90ED28
MAARRRGHPRAPRGWLARIGWMLAIWGISVAGLGLVALAIRALMRLAGMHG